MLTLGGMHLALIQRAGPVLAAGDAPRIGPASSRAASPALLSPTLTCPLPLYLPQATQ